jgi:hypothetical protein
MSRSNRYSKDPLELDDSETQHRNQSAPKGQQRRAKAYREQADHPMLCGNCDGYIGDCFCHVKVSNDPLDNY